MLIETKEIQLGGNPTVSEAGIHPWIREGLGLGGSTPGGGERGGLAAAVARDCAISTRCSQCRPHRRRLSRRRRCARPHRSKAHSNCFISFRGASLKEESVGVITSAARVRGLHSNRQQCTFFSQTNYFSPCCRNWVFQPRRCHIIPLWSTLFPFFAISEVVKQPSVINHFKPSI